MVFVNVKLSVFVKLRVVVTFDILVILVVKLLVTVEVKLAFGRKLGVAKTANWGIAPATPVDGTYTARKVTIASRGNPILNVVFLLK